MEKRMKAAVLRGIEDLRIEDVPVPKIRNNTDVLIRIQSVGICGSDVHYYATGRIGDQVVQFPQIIGHETAGIVEAVGPAVKRVKPGDRIAVDPAVSCGECDQCRAGRYHTCRGNRFLGCPGQLEGCLCELIVMPESCCYPVPEGLSLDDAVLCEPLSIGLYAVKLSIPKEGASAGIIGAGPIGLSVLLCAGAYGCERVYVSDPVPARRRAAADNGAAWAGIPEELDAAVNDGEPDLLDAAFECSGTQEGLDQAVRLVKPGGRLMIIGIPEFDRFGFDAHTARRHEITLQNVRRQNGCIDESLELVARGEIDPSFMKTHEFPLEEAPRAFSLIRSYSDGVIKPFVRVP